jgi:hypothetical protein
MKRANGRSLHMVMGRSAILSALLLGCGAAAQAFQVTNVTAQVTPQQYQGPCPATVTFSGTITVDGPGTVSYRWEHSPGTGTLKQITFAQAGTQTVSQTYTSGGNDFLELVTVTPNQKIKMASFTVKCQEPAPDLTIDPHPASPLPFGRAQTQSAGALRIVVVNIGTGPYAPPPVARVAVKNRKGELIGAANLSAGIPPNGGKTTVAIPISVAPHLNADREAFSVTVDDQQRVKESREDNNTITVRSTKP